MRQSVPTRVLLQLCQASPETLAEVERLLAREVLYDHQKAGTHSPSIRARWPGASEPGAQGSPAYAFRWTGRDWEVVVAGARPCYLEDMLGARYLNYLLHHPNEPISAFDLEVAVQPEKGEARSRNTIQPQSDPRARREYGRALRRSLAELAEARAAGDQEEVARLDDEIAALESALKPDRGAADAGERARNNVRKAAAVVLEQLSKGGLEERAFAEHLRTQLSIGIECLYSQPQGRIWA